MAFLDIHVQIQESMCACSGILRLRCCYFFDISHILDIVGLSHEAPPKCCPRNAPNASSNLITTHYMHSKDQNMMYIWFCMYVISLSLWSISSASEPVWRPLVDQAQLPCDLETSRILFCQSPTTRPHPRKDSWFSNYLMVRSMSLWSMFLVSYTFSTQDSCHFVDSLGKGFT